MTVPATRFGSIPASIFRGGTSRGVLLALDGLHPPSMGFRVTYSGGKPTVVDGPFAEVKEVVGGYWMMLKPLPPGT